MQSNSRPPAHAFHHRAEGRADAPLASAGGCAGEIARYRAMMANDLATGHVAKSVHTRVTAEIDRAAAVCAAGRGVEAARMIEATKARYGYR
jgi:hypothetical protein